jgi:hypothetical protein
MVGLDIQFTVPFLNGNGHNLKTKPVGTINELLNQSGSQAMTP